MRQPEPAPGQPDRLVAGLGTSQEAIALIAQTLEHVVRQNHDLRQSQPTSFDAVAAPSISVQRYLTRIRQYTKFHDECYVVALVYLDRLFANHKAPFLPTPHNVHRLIITSILVASKFYDDVFHSNSFMAQVGGISVAEMNKLEIELCIRLKWDLHVVQDEYNHFVLSLRDLRNAHLWKQWQHQSAAQMSSDDDVTPVEDEAARLTPRNAAASFVVKAKLPLWATGMRGAHPEPQAQHGTVRRAPSSTQGSASPVTSVSVH